MGSITVSKVNSLKGTVKVSGSKNAAIPIICTSIINKGVVTLRNVPKITDIYKLLKILIYLRCKVTWKKYLIIDSRNIIYKPLLLNECKEIRGSYYLIPVMLYLFNKCEILLPGGCNIGSRPIDEHIRGFEALGYNVIEEDDKLIIDGEIDIDDFMYKMTKDSVGASINMIIACLKCRYARLDHLVVEPEGIDVINFLNCLGFNITYLNRLCVIKESIMTNMHAAYSIIPDRMEAITFIVMGLLCGHIKVKDLCIEHIKYPLDLLIKNGYKIKVKKDCVIASKSRGSCFNIRTDIFPLFPTDMQPLFGVLMAYGRGSCMIEESIFEKRMQIYNDLNRFGGYINIIGNRAYVIGCERLKRVDLECRDLRHGAAIILLALKNGGKVSNIEVINRGYEMFFKKVDKLGAKIVKN